MAESIEDQGLPDVAVEPEYLTDDSHISGVSTETANIEFIQSSPYKGGIISLLQDETSEEKEHNGYYVNVMNTTPVNEIAGYMDKAWRLKSPNIVLSVITNNKYTERWTDQKLIDDFQTGIIQAANSTEMWIITNGLDHGVTKIIGDAIHSEKERRNIPLMKFAVNFMDLQFEEDLPKLTTIGIVPKLKLSYADEIDGTTTETLKIQNEGGKSKSDLVELNPDHNHFILVENLSNIDDIESFRVDLEERFLSPIGKPKKYKKIVPLEHSDSSDAELMSTATEDVTIICKTNTPLVGLLLQGGPAQIDHVAELLKRKIPVIVIKGTGSAADLISFVLQEMQERGEPEHVESYIKPELIARITKCYSEEFKDNEIARNRCRDKILECVDNSQQDGQKFLTILETQGISSDLENLNKYILLALFESQTVEQGIRFQDQLQIDLKLTLDWNTCDLAQTQIFQKYDWAKIKIPDALFDDSLLKADRENFVDLFLEKKAIVVHKYLHHKKLLYLFNNIENPEFFMTLCLESLLERALDTAYPIEKKFIIGENSELNNLLYKVTNLKKLVSTYDLSMNSVGKYVCDPAVAERRAINTLVYWAALTNNIKLTKTLWKYTDDPMPMSLVVSMIWHNLSANCYRDMDTKMKLNEAAVEFGKLAVKLLDLTYRESSALAIACLEKPLPDFNNLTVIEIAQMSRNKQFIAHMICQKWLSRKWYGNLNIREVDFKAFRLPDWFKIYASIFLIFPMFIWISYDRGRKKRSKSANEGTDEVNLDDEAMLMKPLANNDPWILSTVTHGVTTVTHGVKYRLGRMLAYGKQNLKVPIYLQFYYFWSAPITKFWVSQLFYIFYLILFSLSVIFPSCGNVHLDFTVLFWTGLIWIEIVRTTFVKKKKYLEIRLFWTIAEIFFMGAFVVVFCLFRIVPHYVGFIDYMTTKFVMSVGLLYFYYRTLFVFLRISPVLGPMLISIKRMFYVDFLTWFRLFLIVMVSGGITIQATIYPNYPFTADSITRAMSRAFFAMFLTKIDDLEGDDKCSYLYQNDSLTHCEGLNTDIFSPNASSSTSTPVSEVLKTCPYSSYGGYLIVIQYLLLIKLILVTLLYALFSATQAKVTEESADIWKYQKYSLIVDFDERLRLPPPLTIISYIIMFFEALYREARHCFRKCKKCCKRCCGKKKDKLDRRSTVRVKRSEDYSYWRNCVKKLIEGEEREKMDKERGKLQSQSLLVLQTEIEKQKRYSKKLFNQVAQVEKGLTSCFMSLENIKHMIETFDTKRSMPTAHEVNTFHILSRQSPYPGQQIQRFPVFDKYVPWEVPYPSYDPAIYTSPVEDFLPELQKYIDLDLLELNENIESNKVSMEDLREMKRANSRLDPKWNDKTTLTVGDLTIDVDRTSWINMEGIPYTYELDASGIPRNPIGRTGLRGRGKLWRWGPNHCVMVLISRWKKTSPTDYLLIEGKHVMEFIAIDEDNSGRYMLPRGSDYGNMSVYSGVCKTFQKLALEEDDSQINSRMSQQDMCDYFSKFSVKSPGPVRGYTSQIVHRGYFDDHYNTDNAWKEAEVWNLHYQGEDTLDAKMKNKEKKWKEATSYTKLHGNQNFIVQKAVSIHGAYY